MIIAPVFEKENYESTIKEDFPVNATIIQVRAEDSDVGLNGQIVYSFDPEDPGSQWWHFCHQKHHGRDSFSQASQLQEW